MKKVLLLIVLFTVTVVFAGNEKNEVQDDLKIMVVEINLNCVEENNEELIFDACGDLGNLMYEGARNDGHSHRTARSIRRDFVRRCRAIM